MNTCTNKAFYDNPAIPRKKVVSDMPLSLFGKLSWFTIPHTFDSFSSASDSNGNSNSIILSLLSPSEKTKPQSEIEKAYEALGLKETDISKKHRFTEKQAKAFNTMLSLYSKEKLTGNDGRFDSGDIDAIKANLYFYERPFADRAFKNDPDLLNSKKIDVAKRTITSGELVSFRNARDLLLEYAKSIGRQPKDKHYMPNRRKTFFAYTKALLLDKEIPKEVESRKVETKL